MEASKITKQRIKLSARQVQQDKARAVHRATNGTVNRCLKIFNKTLLTPRKFYLKEQGRIIVYESEIEAMKKEMMELKK